MQSFRIFVRCASLIYEGFLLYLPLEMLLSLFVESTVKHYPLIPLHLLFAYFILLPCFSFFIKKDFNRWKSQALREN